MSAENPFRAALEWFGPSGERWKHGGPGDIAWDDTYARLNACSVIVLDEVPLAPRIRMAADQLLNNVAGAMFPDRIDVSLYLCDAAAVNDHPHTTFDDIRSLFEKCAIRWDEQEALR